MSVWTSPAEESAETTIAAGLAKLAELPEWLLAPLQAGRVRDALRRGVPEFASGALALTGVKIRRMLLKDDRRCWAGVYQLTIEDPASGTRAVELRGTFTPPSVGPVEAHVPEAPFGAAGWRIALPELGLELEPEPAESALPAMPRLTGPESSRALLEQGIRACAHADMRIAGCRPEVLSYKPGSRCTIRYHLTYPGELADRGWPATVIAKTYRKESKGRNAYQAMVALWNTPLARGDVVTLAEPLAYLPELRVMVQGPIAGDQSLEDLLKAALKVDTPEAYAALNAYVLKSAAGLAALHRSGVRHGQLLRLDDHYAELHDRSARLYAVAPELQGAAEPLLGRLEALAAQILPAAAVPTHGTFSPEQVLVDGDRIGFIDFDEFCMAEPALDVGLYRAAIKDIGMNAPGAGADRGARLARLERLDAIGDAFLDEYERHAPISRERVALWEAWSYLRDALHFWIKVKPAEPDNAMMMLTRHLPTLLT